MSLEIQENTQTRAADNTAAVSLQAEALDLAKGGGGHSGGHGEGGRGEHGKGGRDHGNQPRTTQSAQIK